MKHDIRIRTAQQPSEMPIHKYRPDWQTNPFELHKRTWPEKNLDHAPRWLSTDLRDGNQALIEPMNSDRKLRMFQLLVQMGYKEIEVGFPAASQTDFDFVRYIIENDEIPEDVTISILSQARTDLIERSVESLVGAHRANVHIYNATAPVFREVVFRNDKARTIDLAVSGTTDVIQFAEKLLGDDTIFGFQYSPEIFTDTEIDFALEISHAVANIWQPAGERELILNLPATVERSTPNVYADRIEWFVNNLDNRENIAISVHPHNDRGTAVAAAELAVMAGADRVEGCLFGQGERTGNVDLVTLGLNLFSQGIDPQIDFSDIDHIRRTVEYCTQMDVHPRHPYGGDLVYTSFSGSHQDAIKKGFEAQERLAEVRGVTKDDLEWNIPYLPIDPQDVGRSYEAVIRVNSQSGKGGIAYLLKTDHKLDLPRRLQIEFSRAVQNYTDSSGLEVDSDQIWEIFQDEYLPVSSESDLEKWGRFELRDFRVTSSHKGQDSISVQLADHQVVTEIQGVGNGPLDAFVQACKKLGVEIEILDYVEHALSEGEDAYAASYVECLIDDQVLWGVGIHHSITTASLKAVISAINRAIREKTN